jgi:hypothetical protein
MTRFRHPGRVFSMQLLRLTILTAVVAFATAVVPVAWAGEVSPGDITVFQAETPAVAAEVNANFDALIAEIDDNSQRIDALILAVDALETLVQQLDLPQLQVDLDGQTLAGVVSNTGLADLSTAGTDLSVEIPEVDSRVVVLESPQLVAGATYRFGELSSSLVQSTTLANFDEAVTLVGFSNGGTITFAVDGSGSISGTTDETEVIVSAELITGGQDVFTSVGITGSSFVNQPDSVAFTFTQTGTAISTSIGLTFYASGDGSTIFASGFEAADPVDGTGGDHFVIIGVRAP